MLETVEVESYENIIHLDLHLWLWYSRFSNKQRDLFELQINFGKNPTYRLFVKTKIHILARTSRTQNLYLFSNYITSYILYRSGIIHYYTIMTSNRFQWVSFYINFDKFAYIQIAKMRIIDYILLRHLFILMELPFLYV